MRTSGIVPVHNEEAVLARVLHSIESQTRQADELILVLDACTDRSEAIARKHPAKLVRVAERNMSAAVLAGTSRASHDVLVLFDGNTLVPGNYLARLLEVYEQTDADLVEWHGGMMLLPRRTLDRYGPFSRMALWTLEYFLRIESNGGKVVRLNGVHTRLKRSPIARNIRYGLDYAELSERYRLTPFFRIGTKSGLIPDLVAAAGTVVGHARRRRLGRSVKMLIDVIGDYQASRRTRIKL